MTKKELGIEVERLNKKYCKNTVNKLEISQAYGGYCVYLVGKRNKNGKLKKGACSGRCDVSTPYHDTATKTFINLMRSDSKGFVKGKIRSLESKKSNNLERRNKYDK